ncbi:MAG: hypothetical protein JXA82_06790 [Sedimentisphaerales bacterium]|nr:hypothetical protein [Sedimentisphaerales bacterium]
MANALLSTDGNLFNIGGNKPRLAVRETYLGESYVMIVVPAPNAKKAILRETHGSLRRAFKAGIRHFKYPVEIQGYLCLVKPVNISHGKKASDTTPGNKVRLRAIPYQERSFIMDRHYEMRSVYFYKNPAHPVERGIVYKRNRIRIIK